jgi:hypothetical protein
VDDSLREGEGVIAGDGEETAAGASEVSGGGASEDEAGSGDAEAGVALVEDISTDCEVVLVTVEYMLDRAHDVLFAVEDMFADPDD